MSHSSSSSSNPSLSSDGSGTSSYNGLSTATIPLDRNRSRLTEFGFRNTLTPKNKGFFERIRGRADSKEDAAKGGGAIPEEEDENDATAESVATGRRQPRPRTPPSPAGQHQRQSQAHHDAHAAEGAPIWSPPPAGSAPDPTPAPPPRAAPAAPPATLNRQYWMSDENCKVCYDCGLAFHFWRRRHHCRLCGQIFCGSCSDQTVDGNRYQLKDGQVRVCKHCFALDKGNSALLSMAANTIGQAPAGAAAAVAPATAPTPRTPAPARADGPAGGTSGTPHLTRANSLQPTQSLSSSSSPIVRPPAVSAVDGLTGIDGQAAASSTGGLAGSSYMDKLGRPLSGGGTTVDGTALPDDLDIPGTKFKRRSNKSSGAAFGAAAVTASSAKKAAAGDAGEKDGGGTPKSSSPPLDGSATGVGSATSPATVPSPDDESSSDEDVPVGENEEDSDAYDEEDDYVSASNNPAQHPTIDPTSPTSPMPEANGFPSAVPRAPQANSSTSQRQEGPSAATSPTMLHSLQLTEQQNEIQLMALHRHRIHKVNKQHLLYVVACLARGYDVEEKWIATVLNFAERCTANLCVEPNKRTRHSMAIAAASGGALTTNPGGNSLAMAGLLDDHMDITPYVKIKSLPGGTQSECRLIEGVMFRKNIAHKKMRSFVKNPRVLLLGCALEYQRIENRLSSLDTVLEQEKEYIQLQINKILAWRPDVIVVEKSVSRLAQDLIRAAGVTLVLNVKPSLMARLARATRATPIVPASDYIDKCASIGQCGRFIVETFTTQDDPPPASSLSPQEIARQRAMSVSAAAAAARVIVMSFEECATRYHATIMLRGAPTATLKRLKYILRMAIHTAYHLSLEAALLFDECATYSDANLEKLQNNYYNKIATLWGAQSEIAGQFLSRQAKLKFKTEPASADASNSSNGGVTEPLSPGGSAPPLPSTPAPMRAGYSIPLSSSPFVDLVLVPIPQNIVDARRVLNIGQNADASSSSSSSPGSATPSNNLPPLWIHDCILFGSTWFSAAFQCFAPEVKGIEFYTATDKTLGCFLLENCFDLKLRCLNEKCGKDVLKHILAYTHHEGRIVITVKKIRKKAHHNSLLFSPAPIGGQGAGRTLASLAEHGEHSGSIPATPLLDGDAASAPWSSATPSSSSSHPGTIRHPLDHPSDIMMWSRCRVCGRRVTPYMAMSDPTYKVSFGKYLDLTFHQKAAVCRTGSCTHSLHENHVRFFGYGGLMASFEYEPFPSYTMVTIPKSVQGQRDACLVLKYESELKALALISYVVFEEFIVRIAEIDGLLDKQEQRDQLRRLTKKVCKERDRFTTYLQQIGLGPPKSKAQLARTATGLETAVLALAVDPAMADGTAPAGPEPALSIVPPASVASPAPGALFGCSVPSSSAATAVVLFDCMDVYRLQRRLILNFLSWNNKLSDLSVLFFPKHAALSHSQSAKEAISAWWNRPREVAAVEPVKHNSSKESSTSTSVTNNRDPTQTPPDSRRESASGVVASSTAVVVDGALSPDPAAPAVGGPLSPQFLSPTPSDGGSSLSDSSSFKVLPASGSFGQVHSPLPMPITPAPMSNNTPNTATEPTSAAATTPAEQQQQQRSSTQPPASTAAPASAPAAAAPKQEPKKAEFSFRDLFNRMTTDTNSKVSSVHSFNVTVEMLTAHNPQLPTDSFDCLKQPPHLGLPPVLPPLSIPVQDDQPSSIIAYTLASLEHLLSVGRIRSNEVKVLQHQQSWMAYEEEQAVCELDLAPPKPARSERNDREEQHPQPARASSSSISSSRSSLPFPAPLQSSGSFGSHASSSPDTDSETSGQGRARDESTSGSSANGPAASASPSHATGTTQLPLSAPLHHSYSEHHISFLYPHSQHTSLPHRAPPPLPQHLTAPSLLGFDPIRDRLDLVESTMTKFWNGGDSAAMPPPTSASSGPHSTSSTDHAQHTFKYQFEDTGMAGSLSGVLHHEATMSPDPHAADVERTIFRCTVYFPRQFHALRLMTLGGDYDFIQSLCHCTRWGVTGGKSGSTFLKTSDERFILKCITRTELKMFLEGAHKYFAYMAKNVFHALPSFLVKILGVYQLSWKKHNFKRKESNTSADKAKGESESESSMHNASSLSSQYILVMPNLFFGKAQEGISKIFDLKGSARNRYVKRKNREENRVLLDENLMEYTDGYPLPLNDSSKQLLRMSVFNDTLFLSNLEIVDYSIIVGLQTNNQKLVVGIIDYIRQYTWDKRLEMGVKSVGMIAGQNIPTIISPQNYKMRFRLAMERYFMVSPDHSSRLTLLSTNSAANDTNEKESK